MVDYERLAAQAKAAQDAANLASRKEKQSAGDPKVFFQRVTAQILEEMNRANVELAKRGVSEISRNHLPGFEGVVFLVFGMGHLCRVELEVLMRGAKIKAIICGPPNGNELSRREFFFGQNLAPFGPSTESTEPQVVGPSAQEIAQDIIAGIVLGTFD